MRSVVVFEIRGFVFGCIWDCIFVRVDILVCLNLSLVLFVLCIC